MIREFQVDHILLIGWMRILSPTYCEQLGSDTINTHPSLLPLFAGMKSPEIFEKIIDHEERYSGCTLHRVSSELDAGEMVLQRKIPVNPDETTESLKARTQRQEVLGFCEFLERRK